MNSPLFVGFCTVDTIHGEQYLGGAAGASALNAARLGYHPSLVSVLSQDERGTHYKKALTNAGINITRCITTSPSIPTCEITDVMGQGTSRIWNDNGALNTLANTSLSLPSDGFDSIFLYSCNPIFQKAVETNAKAVPIAYIPGPQLLTVPTNNSMEILKKVTVLFLNDEECQAIPLTTAFEQGVQVVIVTTGKKGGIIYTRDNKQIPFIPPETIVTDTTGAGDSFALGFSLSYFEDKNIQTAITKGTTLVTEILQQSGAVLSQK